jgi:hypothetical protein
MEAHVRLIAALDRGIPCWLETNHKLERIDRSVDQFDLALAQMAKPAGTSALPRLIASSHNLRDGIVSR